MPIDEVELAELFLKSIGRADIDGPTLRQPPQFKSDGDSYFAEPDETLKIPSQSLTELLDGNANLMMSLAENWERDGQSSAAAALRELDAFIGLHAHEIGADSEGAKRRIVDFVYPVV